MLPEIGRRSFSLQVDLTCAADTGRSPQVRLTEEAKEKTAFTCSTLRTYSRRMSFIIRQVKAVFSFASSVRRTCQYPLHRSKCDVAYFCVTKSNGVIK